MFSGSVVQWMFFAGMSQRLLPQSSTRSESSSNRLSHKPSRRDTARIFHQSRSERHLNILKSESSTKYKSECTVGMSLEEHEPPR